MKIDREILRQAFDSYVAFYDATDPKISLKIYHTYQVAEICERIGKSIGLEGIQLDTVWACGMLHDIGRFEQIRQYGTFVDAKSMDHALLSEQILFGDDDGSGIYGRIREFVTTDVMDTQIRTAVLHHSAYRLPEGLDEWTLTCCQVLRDADKVDIFRVNLETPLEQIYNVTTEELMHCSVSEAVMGAFFEHHAVLRSLKSTPIDNLVGHVCLAYELVYPESKKLALEQGFLHKMMEFRNEDEVANEQMRQIQSHMTKYLDAGKGSKWNTF